MNFANKKILILGLAREGESSFRFLRKQFPDKNIGLADKTTLKELPESFKKIISKDRNIKLHLGKNYLKSITEYDIIIKTPGVPKKIILPYLSKNQIITSQTEIFLDRYSKQTIGITGTKGKGTTSILLYNILKTSSKKAELIGNIGNPPLNYFENGKSKNTFVFEMSAHQLEQLKISPHIAVFLNFHEGHLDYYKNIKEYFSAKTNITLWQKSNDFFIFNNDSPELKNLAKKVLSQKISFGKNPKNDCYFTKQAIFFKKNEIIKLKDVPLQGEHFIYDIMAVVCTACLLKIPVRKIRKSIKEYKTQKHCLQFFGKFKRINFYDDSFASEPIAAICAIKAIKPQTIILGGYERNLNFFELAKIVVKNNVKTIILFPPSGKRIKQALSKEKKGAGLKFILVKNMEEAVRSCYRNTEPQEVCLLSPGAASFGIFKDYKDRGEQFQKFVKQLSK
ncbi:MAG: UDP-N-acetylmuramoyl-L-alanine--D-glutamate ligase [Candidatus Parcubacteria bacterium]|nr:UDP-N-acetylmuramoyl-L-alanine--D-glutamate ligase [Candidatus Parcubacteria bacterium]